MPRENPKTSSLKKKRAKYIQERVARSKRSARKEVSKLSNELFISERSVWNDLKKNI